MVRLISKNREARAGAGVVVEKIDVEKPDDTGTPGQSEKRFVLKVPPALLL
jgi:hypothetical protein